MRQLQMDPRHSRKQINPEHVKRSISSNWRLATIARRHEVRLHVLHEVLDTRQLAFSSNYTRAIALSYTPTSQRRRVNPSIGSGYQVNTEADLYPRKYLTHTSGVDAGSIVTDTSQ